MTGLFSVIAILITVSIYGVISFFTSSREQLPLDRLDSMETLNKGSRGSRRSKDSAEGFDDDNELLLKSLSNRYKASKVKSAITMLLVFIFAASLIVFMYYKQTLPILEQLHVGQQDKMYGIHSSLQLLEM